MKFSATGPDIPSELIEASLGGDVVFIVGAGVSRAAGLPDFKNLTENIYRRLSTEPEPAEQMSIGQSRYEECLGTLSRRLADPRLLHEAVAAELDADGASATATHETILRLDLPPDWSLV